MAQSTASTLPGSMSSSTAITNLPIAACKVIAPLSPRQTSVLGVPRANCRKTTLRRLVRASCSTTLRMPLIASRFCRCARYSGS